MKLKFALGIALALGLSIGPLACKKQEQAQAPQPEQEMEEEAAPTVAMAPKSAGTLTREQYVTIVSEVGCSDILDETSSAANAVYQKYGIGYGDITAFRQGSDGTTMMGVATDVANNVAACHGAGQ